MKNNIESKRIVYDKILAPSYRRTRASQGKKFRIWALQKHDAGAPAP